LLIKLNFIKYIIAYNGFLSKFFQL